MHNRNSLAIMGFLAVGLVGAPLARAGTDELCVEQAYGVPGPQPKHPEWWDLSLTKAQRETRWTGASAIYDTGSVAPPLGSGRVIWDQPSQRLFFQFDITADPALDYDQDIVMLAVSDPTGTEPDLYIQFRPVHDCNPVTNCTGLGAPVSTNWVEYSQATVGTSVTWSPLSTTNPSAIWTVHEPWVEVERYLSQGVISYHWTLKFALEIPVDAGSGEAWPDLRIYGNAVMYMPGPTSGTAVEYPLLCEPSSPTSNDCLVFSTGNNPLPDGLPVLNLDTIWSHVTTGSLALCDGVEAIRTLVGSDYNTTLGTVPGTTIPYDLPGHEIPKYTGAHLRAGFFNDTSNSLGAGDIDADFRIADWGLQWSTWDQASWSLIDSATLSGTVSAGGYAGASGQGQVETAAPWIPASSGLPLTNDHQCMHVRLTANAGGINFKRDSVYRNMDLVNASVFRRPLGLDMTERPIPEGQEANEIYLLVHTEHMPSVEECEEAGQVLRGCAEGGPLVLDPELTAEQLEAMEQAGLEVGGEVGEGGGEEPIPQYATLENLPKLVTYGFAQTNGTINLPDAPNTPVLKPFSDFGYYVQHEGEPSRGWQQYITAPGAEPVEGTPGLYRIGVGENQIVALSQTVRAIDGIQEPCEELPGPGDVMSPDEAMARVLELMEAGFEGVLTEQKVLEPDFGCSPPPLREPCMLGDCPPHSPISYIEGSAYVGQWSDEAVAAMFPGGEIPDHLVGATDPAAEGTEGLGPDGVRVDPVGAGQDGCCTQASVDPQAGQRGAAKLSAMAVLLLLLRRGRRRRRRD